VCGGMAGRYTGSYLERLNGWRAVPTLADIGQASLVDDELSAFEVKLDIASECLHVADAMSRHSA
jgi:hypothetical protein